MNSRRFTNEYGTERIPDRKRDAEDVPYLDESKEKGYKKEKERSIRLH